MEKFSLTDKDLNVMKLSCQVSKAVQKNLEEVRAKRFAHKAVNQSNKKNKHKFNVTTAI